jgi:hydroxymethylbilane synthase
MTALRLGTRRSRLALAQSTQVAAAISAATGRAVELVEITTEGDLNRGALAQIGGSGVFVSALRDALLDGRIDVAVHSLKDLPTKPAAGLELAAVPTREDPRDVLCARDGLTLAELPAGSRIGTGSPRRTAQLRALGFELDVVDVRGNVDTRLRFVTEGKLDGVVLAYAGLARLGRLDVVTEVLDPQEMTPAPGQGALAVECRTGAELTAELAALDDVESRAAVLAERTVLAALEAGCTAPVGAYASPTGSEGRNLILRAVVAAYDGSVTIRTSATAPRQEAETLGRRVAAELLDEGAAALVGAPSREPQEETVS